MAEFTQCALDVHARFPTDACNLRCSYCLWTHNIVEPAIPLENWSNGIIALSNTKQPIHFGFVSEGEPFMEHLKPCHEALKTIADKHWVTHTSNVAGPLANFQVWNGPAALLNVSYHPEFWGTSSSDVYIFCQRIKDIQSTTSLIIKYISVVAFPPLLDAIIVAAKQIFELTGISVFVSSCSVVIGDKTYPRDYTDDERAEIKSYISGENPFATHPLGQPIMIGAEKGLHFSRICTKGRKCNAGKDLLFIATNGDILPCTSSTGEIMANLADMSNFTFLTEPVTCTKNMCMCQAYQRHLVVNQDEPNAQ